MRRVSSHSGGGRPRRAPEPPRRSGAGGGQAGPLGHAGSAERRQRPAHEHDRDGREDADHRHVVDHPGDERRSARRSARSRRTATTRMRCVPESAAGGAWGSASSSAASRQSSALGSQAGVDGAIAVGPMPDEARGRAGDRGRAGSPGIREPRRHVGLDRGPPPPRPTRIVDRQRDRDAIVDPAAARDRDPVRADRVGGGDAAVEHVADRWPARPRAARPGGEPPPPPRGSRATVRARPCRGRRSPRPRAGRATGRSTRREDLVDPLARGPVGRIGEPVGLDHARCGASRTAGRSRRARSRATMPMTG